ncbi:MAG TPA: hypothetical protein VGJ81_08885 [Thermoanaerobaculia bacterium]|jgi:hypothetical protein
MSANCDITNLVTNQTGYSFVLNTSSLSSGNWVVSPQPIPANAPSFNALQAIGVSGTATGAVGQAIYNVMQNGNNVGTFTFNFSDPYSGSNSCSSSSTVSGLSATNNCPSSGSTFSVSWTISG